MKPDTLPRLLRPLLTLALLVAVGIAPPAFAQDRTGGTFELVGGWYMPEASELDDDVTYGLRGGYRFSDSFGFEGSLTIFEADIANTPIGIDFFLTDASFKWYPGGGRGSNELVVFGGPGWAVIDVDLGGFFGSVSEDSINAHAGLAGELSVGETVYFRPDVRARWIEETEDIDLETTLALGFRF